MKVLVFGKTGQVATELSTFDGVRCLGREDADLTDPGACEAVIAAADVDAVINAAAFTAVDAAEDDRATAMIVNAMAPTAMAAAAAQKDIPFVHISTDYVFDGTGTQPFSPEDITAPQNVYGTSKLGGERGVLAAGGASAVLRTSWVFSAHGNNFLKTMIRLGDERPELSIVADQIGGPTPAKAIAAASMKMAQALCDDPNRAGIYHLSGAPDASWADFAREIFAQSGLATVVNDIPTAEYPTPATRPLNSRLDCATTAAVFGIEQPDWRAGIADVLTDLDRLQS